MDHQIFRLYWLRESGCDSGTVIWPSELSPAIRDRVVALAAGQSGEIAVRLPFLDRRECRRQEEILSALPFERAGNVIRAVLPPPAAARDWPRHSHSPIRSGATLRRNGIPHISAFGSAFRSHCNVG